MKTIILLNGFGGIGDIMEYLSRLQRKGILFDLFVSTFDPAAIEERRYDNITTPHIQVHIIPSKLEGFEAWIEAIAATLLPHVLPGETVLLCCLVQEPVAQAIASRIGSAVEFIGSIV